MLSRLTDPFTQESHSPLFWGVLGCVAAGQLVAIGLLCAHQVRKAEVRHAEAQVRQIALADCLRYVPGASIGTCTRTFVAQGGHAGRPPAARPAAQPLPDRDRAALAPAAPVMPAVMRAPQTAVPAMPIPSAVPLAPSVRAAPATPVSFSYR